MYYAIAGKNGFGVYTNEEKLRKAKEFMSGSIIVECKSEFEAFKEAIEMYNDWQDDYDAAYFGGIKEIEVPIDEWYKIEGGFHEGIYDGDPFSEYKGDVLYTALLNKDSSISIEDRSTLAHDIASSQQKYQSATFWYEMSQNKDINNER